MQCKPQLGSRLSQRTVAAAGGQGFGRTASTDKKGKTVDEERDVPGIKPTAKRVGKGKGKKAFRMQPNAQPAPARPRQSSLAPLQPGQQKGVEQRFMEQLEAKREDRDTDDAAFEKRLAALKQEAAARKAEMSVQQSPAVSPVNPYASPPPLSKTLLSLAQPDSSAMAASSSEGGFGTNQVALAAGSLLLIGIFVISAGGDVAPPRPQPSSQQAEASLSPEAAAKLREQAERFEGQLAAAPSKPEALEGAAVSYAQLGDYKKAAGLLEQLTQQRADDPEAWRLLAETRSRQEDHKGAADAYRRALAAPQGGSLEVVQGLAAELVAAGQPQQAVDTLKQLREQAVARASSSASASPADADAASTPASDDSSTATAASASAPGPRELDLLLGKTLAGWRGHRADAVAVYDRLIAAAPDDFRGYLAKGILLREDGRPGDAQRMFIQARYFAPPSMRAMVDRVINR